MVFNMHNVCSSLFFLFYFIGTLQRFRDDRFTASPVSKHTDGDRYQSFNQIRMSIKSKTAPS